MVMCPISHARQLLDYANMEPIATVRGYSLPSGWLMLEGKTTLSDNYMPNSGRA
jgi:hypothetical protein